jgi:hypothetical protein
LTVAGHIIGDYPLSFSWSNACSGAGGSGILNQNAQEPHPLGPIGTACPTLIRLDGDGNGIAALRYWFWATAVGGSGPCTEAIAVDMGGPANNIRVPSDDCLMIRDAYPINDGESLRFSAFGGGQYPLPFTWSNACSGAGGSGMLTGSAQDLVTLGPLDVDCPTLIDLLGNGQWGPWVRYFYP